jgi:DNA primase
MAGYIPDDVVERIKSESDIVMVISEFISLKKSGKDFKGLCPFHQEKTPSFFVIPSKGFYHCFGCGAGGNVVNFIMAHERLDYPDALRYLARKAGITIPESRGKKSEAEQVFAALELAGSYFVKALHSTEAGAAVLAYLHSRGMSDATIDEFGLGYAPQGWDGLIKVASAREILTSTLEKAGLAVKKEGYYDRFRHRLMIPIKAISGRIVGFGGRILFEDEGPKYINSPETEVYKKGQILFALDVTRDHIRKANEAIVVEGYFDLMALYQHGIKNVVAVSGTGFTPEQASLLGRFSEKAVLLYDSDSAGVKAAYRACGMLYNSALQPRIATLPHGFDPDKFVREKGARPLKELVASSGDIVDFICNSVKGEFSEQSLPVQKRIVTALMNTIEPVSDRLTRNLLLEKVHSRLNIDLKTLTGLKEVTAAKDKSPAAGATRGREKPEREFLALLLSNPEMLAQSRSVVDSEMFVDEANGRLYALLVKLSGDGVPADTSGLFDKLDNEEQRRRLSEIALIEQDNSNIDVLYQEYLKGFKLINVKKRREELKRLIGEAERQADRQKIDELTREFQNLQTRGGNE